MTERPRAEFRQCRALDLESAGRRDAPRTQADWRHAAVDGQAPDRRAKAYSAEQLSPARWAGRIRGPRAGLRREDFMLLHRRLPWRTIGRSRSSPAYRYFSMPWYLRNSI